MKKIFCFIILALIYASCFPQKSMKLSIVPSSSNDVASIVGIIEKLDYPRQLSDTSTAKLDLVLLDVIRQLNEMGFLTANFDSVSRDSVSARSYLNPGPKFTWACVRQGNVDEEYISLSGFREKVFRNKTVHYSELVKAEWNIIRACENNGYPFASVFLDSVEIRGDSISAALHLNTGPMYTIDSIVIKGTAEITDIYIRNYIGIKPGELYNEDHIRQISTRIKEIPFVAETQPVQIEFGQKTCKLYLHLAKKKASQLNGILGVASDELNPGKINITGEFLIRLMNPFGSGELIEINWKSPGKQTQDLKTHLVYPFIISRFGLDLGFSIYKKDTTYIDVIKDFGIQYLLPRGNYLKAFVNNKTSSLQHAEGYENATALPPFADINSTFYGLGLRSEKLDYRLNPRKGVALEVSAATGTRVIEKNPKINKAVYDSLDLRSVQYNGVYSVDYFIPLRSRMVLDIGLKGAHLFNQQIIQNELFRIGGLHSLRGFDEESIGASSYEILKLEFRYLLEQNSYFALFWNGAYYENNAYQFNGDRYDTPYGFGAGISFETRLGIFSLNYALGKQFNNPIEVRQGKIHFGLLNNF